MKKLYLLLACCVTITLTASENVKVYNPAFDVTPNELISGIITEVGVLRADYRSSIKKAFS